MRYFLAALLLFLPCVTAQAADTSPTNKNLKLSQLEIKKTAHPATRFNPLTSATIKKAKLVKFPRLRPVITPAPAKPQGPDSKAALDLSGIIEDPELLDDLGQVCGWDEHLIFQDKAAGHVFYYLPREFLLLRDQNGYKLSVQYNHQAKPGQPSVMLTAELAAPHHAGDIVLLKAILREALGLKTSDRLKIKSLKGLGATVDMQALTAGLSLESDRIHMTPPAHLKQSFRLTLALTQDEVEEVLAQIAREGLAGSLRVQVGADSVPVPIRIQYTNFTGDRVKGFDEWAKGKSISKLVNTTNFPLMVETINGYRIKGNRLERVSKNIKQSKAIPPGKSCSFKLPEVSRLLGQGLLMAWLGTSLDTECTSCLQSVDQAVRKGVALAPGSPLNLEAISSVFSEFGLYKIIIRVRSPYFVAGGSVVQEREAALTEQANFNSDMIIYVPSDRGPNALLYRYQIHVVTEAGELFKETKWRDSHGLSQFLGASQLEDILPQTGETIKQ